MVKVDDMPLKQTLFVLLALVEFYSPTNIHLGAAHDLAHIKKSIRMRSRFQFKK